MRLPGKQILFWIILTVSCLPALSSQDLQLNFHHLSQDDGLSQGTNSYVMQDSRGFIWISSISGLNRYDGERVVTYQPKVHDPTSLASGLINSKIFEDDKGDLWFTSNVAIQRYIRTKDCFETIRISDEQDSLIKEDVMAFDLDNQGNLWLRVGVGDKGRLHIFNTTSRKDSIHYPLDGQRCEVIKDSQGNTQKIVSSLFLETWGFEIIDHKNQERQSYFNKSSRDAIYTTNLWIENANTIWFGSDRGLMRFDTDLGTYQCYNQFEGAVGTVWSIAPWEDKLFVSTLQKGILIFDQKANTFTQQFVHRGNQPNSLRQNEVRELYLDPQDVLWASLWHIGVDYTSLHKIKFEIPQTSALHGPIMSMIEGPGAQIWCTTNRGFLFFDQLHQPIDPMFRNPGWSEITQRKGAPWFFKDRKQRIWLSIGNELYRYVQDDHTFALVGTLPYAPRGIIALSNERTLVSTNQGVFELKFDEALNVEVTSPVELLKYQKEPFEAMYEDSLGFVYFSKNSQSLVVFRMAQGSLSFFKEIDGLGDCKAFLERPHDSIWICTDAAVIALDRKTFGYRAMLEASDGLPVELYYCMIPDAAGKIWLSGNNGIVRYDPNENNYHRYTREDGLQSLEFNTNAYCLSSTGDIWLGGTNGINVFNPLNVTHILDKPQIQITNLLINDEPYVTDTFTSEINALSLDYKHNTLSFEFVGLEFSDPKARRYRYRMTGFENDWVEGGVRNFARYPNLPPGDYQFEVIASNSDGVWNLDAPRILKISISPPFTQTIWFYLILMLIGGTMAYMVYHFQLKRKLEIAEKQRLLEMDELKNRLYTNITHEFRTPLTLIHGPVSNALSTNNVLDKKDLKNIYNQSERLQQLIDQILDLQKAEAGKLKANYVYGNVIPFIQYLFRAFELFAKEKGVSLVHSTMAEEIAMDYDEEKLTQIINNLVSNAIKHLPKNGKVSLTTEKSPAGNALRLRIQDTGMGISQEDLPYIFDRYYQSSRAAVGGTGIGLALTKSLVELLGGSIRVESIVNFGTTFEVELPITANAKGTSPAHSYADTMDMDIMTDEAMFLPGVSDDTNKPLVLIAEDHREVLEYLTSCLAQDFTIMTCMDGDEAMRKGYEHIPDLIISDVIMPGKDGFELCNALKTDIRTSHIPIILLTGKRDQASLLTGIEHGADAYIVKPFNPQELILRVKKLLELRSNLSQYYRSQVTSGSQETGVQASAKENAFLQQVRTIIEAHLSDAQLNMQLLSQQMAMSHSQLHRKLTALTGESATKFVRTVRLNKAKDLLKKSDLTISEIAYETGFSEPGYFTKVFSKEFEMTPSEFRTTGS